MTDNEPFFATSQRQAILHSIAYDIVSKQRGKETEYVPTYKGAPINRTLNCA